MLSLIFGQSNWQKIQIPFANNRLFIVTSITVKRKTFGNCTSLACKGKVLLSWKLYPKSKKLILDPKQPQVYGAEYVGDACLQL